MKVNDRVNAYDRFERSPGDRRSSTRFPLQREVRHQGIGGGGSVSGSGETVNVSSRGVLFTTNEELRRGQWVELSISWPAQLDSQIGLQLVARGPVVRTEVGRVAMAIHQHEFRTQGAPRVTGKRS